MNVERFARVTDPDLNAQRGAIRRMVVSRASAVLWQLLGFTIARKKETTRGVEVFHGVGAFDRARRHAVGCTIARGNVGLAVDAYRDLDAYPGGFLGVVEGEQVIDLHVPYSQRVLIAAPEVLGAGSVGEVAVYVVDEPNHDS